MKVYTKKGDDDVEHGIGKGEVLGMFALRNVLNQATVTLGGGFR